MTFGCCYNRTNLLLLTRQSSGGQQDGIDIQDGSQKTVPHGPKAVELTEMPFTTCIIAGFSHYVRSVISRVRLSCKHSISIDNELKITPICNTIKIMNKSKNRLE